MIHVIVITELSSGDRQIDASASLTSRPSLLGLFRSREPVSKLEGSLEESHTRLSSSLCYIVVRTQMYFVKVCLDFTL